MSNPGPSQRPIAQWEGYDYEEIERRSFHSNTLCQKDPQQTDLDSYRVNGKDRQSSLDRNTQRQDEVSKWLSRMDRELLLPTMRVDDTPGRPNSRATTAPSTPLFRFHKSAKVPQTTGQSRHKLPENIAKRPNFVYARKTTQTIRKRTRSPRPIPKEKDKATAPSTSHEVVARVRRSKRPHKVIDYQEDTLAAIGGTSSVLTRQESSGRAGQKGKSREPKPLELPPPCSHHSVDNKTLEYEEADQLVDEVVSFDDQANDLPVRRITHFTIFEKYDSNGGGPRLYAFGSVKPKFEQTASEDEDDIGAQEIQANTETGEWRDIVIGPIEEYADMFEEKFGDRKVWLRTSLAWYFLQRPRSSYRKEYRPFFLVHMLTHYLLSCAKQNTQLSLNLFVNLVVGSSSPLWRTWVEAQGVLGKRYPISEEELFTVLPKIGSCIQTHKAFDGIRRVPVIHHITRPAFIRKKRAYPQESRIRAQYKAGKAPAQ